MTPYVGSGPYCYANTLCAVVDPSWPPGPVETLTGSPFGFQITGNAASLRALARAASSGLAAVQRDGDSLAQAFDSMADLHEEHQHSRSRRHGVRARPRGGVASVPGVAWQGSLDVEAGHRALGGPMRPALHFWWVVGGVSVLALWTSSGLYAATTLGLMGPQEPDPGGPLAPYVESYLAYRRGLLPFEQWQNWSLTLALLGIGLTAAGLFLMPPDGKAAPPRLGALALGSGSVVAAVAQVAYLGAAERALAVSDVVFFDPGSLASMVDVATRTDDYVENLGFLMMAAGLVGLAWPRGSLDADARWLPAASWALALSLAAVTVASFASSALVDPILLVVGFALAPTWAILTARILDVRLGARGEP